MSNVLSSRAHLEAVLLARVLLDLSMVDRVDVRCLSPAAQRLVLAVTERPTIARLGGFLSACEPSGDATADGFVERLAKRASGLSLMELTYYDTDALLSMVNHLPQMGLIADRRRRSA